MDYQISNVNVTTSEQTKSNGDTVQTATAIWNNQAASVAASTELAAIAGLLANIDNIQRGDGNLVVLTVQTPGGSQTFTVPIPALPTLPTTANTINVPVDHATLLQA